MSGMKLAATLIALPMLVATGCQDDSRDRDLPPWEGDGDGNDGSADGGGDGGGSDGGGDDGSDGGGDAGSDGGGDDGASGDSGDDGGSGTGDDGASDSGTGGGGPCEGYRSEYPGGPYGTSVGSVLADVPGMVDGSGNPHDFFEIYQDTSKVALAIANAFDT